MQCWICGQEATTGEHLFKASDIRALFGPVSQKRPIPAITTYTRSIVGPLSEDVHWQTMLPTVLPKSERDEKRMPTDSVQLQIFERDGWRCRFCGINVICKDSRSRLVALFPEETHWVDAEYARHSSLYASAASLDHIVPHSRGGNNAMENLVTACYCCQFGRGNFTLEEVGFSDPRDRAPIVDDWDGLTRIKGVDSAV